MKTYDEIKTLLLKLCKNEGLKFIETELKNKKICCARVDNIIIINKNYHRFKAVAL